MRKQPPSGAPEPKSASGAAKPYSVEECKKRIVWLVAEDIGVSAGYLAAALRVVEAALAAEELIHHWRCYSGEAGCGNTCICGLNDLDAALSEWSD